MLAHKAWDEGVTAVENMRGEHNKMNYNAIPTVLFMYPEVAYVGYNENDLKKEGKFTI